MNKIIKNEIKDGNYVFQIYDDGHLEIFDFYDGNNWKMLSIPNMQILKTFLNNTEV